MAEKDVKALKSMLDRTAIDDEIFDFRGGPTVMRVERAGAVERASGRTASPNSATR